MGFSQAGPAKSTHALLTPCTAREALNVAANETSTAMAREAAEAPTVVETILKRNRKIITDLVSILKSRHPTHILTSARGSSDHAASYFKYLCEICLGIPCCSLGAS